MRWEIRRIDHRLVIRIDSSIPRMGICIYPYGVSMAGAASGDSRRPRRCLRRLLSASHKLQVRPAVPIDGKNTKTIVLALLIASGVPLILIGLCAHVVIAPDGGDDPERALARMILGRYGALRLSERGSSLPGSGGSL